MMKRMGGSDDEGKPAVSGLVAKGAAARKMNREECGIDWFIAIAYEREDTGRAELRYIGYVVGSGYHEHSIIDDNPGNAAWKELLESAEEDFRDALDPSGEGLLAVAADRSDDRIITIDFEGDPMPYRAAKAVIAEAIDQGFDISRIGSGFRKKKAAAAAGEPVMLDARDEIDIAKLIGMYGRENVKSIISAMDMAKLENKYGKEAVERLLEAVGEQEEGGSAGK